MGEGIVSIFAIVDSLYDSKKDDVIVIDEPELSLHPALQKRVFSLISEFSKDRQIINIYSFSIFCRYRFTYQRIKLNKSD